MRGVMPKGVMVPRGEIRLRLSPIERPSWPASREPMATPFSSSKRSSVPRWIFCAIAGTALRSSPRMPRTSTPVPAAGEEAKAWPSIMPLAETTSSASDW